MNVQPDSTRQLQQFLNARFCAEGGGRETFAGGFAEATVEEAGEISTVLENEDPMSEKSTAARASPLICRKMLPESSALT